MENNKGWDNVLMCHQIQNKIRTNITRRMIILRFELKRAQVRLRSEARYHTTFMPEQFENAAFFMQLDLKHPHKIHYEKGASKSTCQSRGILHFNMDRKYFVIEGFQKQL